MTANDASWQDLRQYWQELSDWNGIDALLNWDQSTYLPAQAASGRSRQQALLSRIAHQRATAPEYGQQLEAAAARTDLSPQQARMVAVARKNFDRATRLPSDFVAAFAGHTGEAYSAWTKARPANDFAAMVPYLEKTLDLRLQQSAYFPEFTDPMDYFIDRSEEGMSAAQVDTVFKQLREVLVPLVDAVCQAPAPRSDFLYRCYPQALQLKFGQDITRDYGYSYESGRLDLTHHPFMTRLGAHDLRITTRVQENDLSDNLYSTLHEAGHALYEQGIAAEYLDTPLGGGVSAGVHESSSRLWENQVGRSRAFWAAYFGRLRDTFPEQLGDVTEEEVYRGVNAVKRSLIRTESDELTYNLHVMIRYELERQLLSGKLAVRDLAEAWHAAYEDSLGLRAPDDRDGVLQDVHWYAGSLGGAFQGYTLGNILSAQFYAAAQAARPALQQEIERRDFSGLHHWLKEKVYQHGEFYSPNELVEVATGQPMTVEPYLRYLREKYGELYRLN